MDAEASTIVIRFSGRTLSVEDYDRCFRDFISFVEVTPEARRALVFFIVDRECPAPNAAQRARFVDMGRGLAFREADFVYVTESTISRGVLTAIRWLRPKRDGHRDASFRSVDAAMGWLSAHTKREHVARTLIDHLVEREELARVASR